MKKFKVLLVLMFTASLFITQAQTVKIPGANATVTNEQIKAWGDASLQNANRDLVVLNFEGLGDEDGIAQYYNGGLSTMGNGPGPNYGIYFGGTTLSIIDADAGGTGNIANEPSPSTTMFFLTGGSATMNVTAGFITGFSFYYSSSAVVTIFVYDGLDGTGNLLATQSFPANYNLDCTGDPTGGFCNWDPAGVGFAGTAKSVTFQGVINQCTFDDVTFGSINPGPVPVSNWALFIGIGLILIFAVVRFRRFI
jgi:hypothetical protein